MRIWYLSLILTLVQNTGSGAGGPSSHLPETTDFVPNFREEEEVQKFFKLRVLVPFAVALSRGSSNVAVVVSENHDVLVMTET